MSRMKIDLPDTWAFETEIQVRVSDLNYGNHLANQQFLAFAQEARLQFFQKFGFSELDFGGVSLIQADAAIIFKNEAHLGDTVQVKLTAIKGGSASFNVYYLMQHKQTFMPIAELRTAIVCFDYATKKPVAIPDTVLNSNLFLT